jgi:hypothetical protein
MSSGVPISLPLPFVRRILGCVSGSDNPLLVLGESRHAFLSSRPQWTVNGALLKTADGRAARLAQTPFVWVAGAWEAMVTILPIEPTGDARSLEIQVCVTTDTLRRWTEIGINPFLEACAQLEEYWRTARPFDGAQLTWL